MKKWEYMIVDSKDVPGGRMFRGKDRAEVDTYLNQLGEEGWEIVNLDFHELGNRFDFSGVAKREKD
jgi:hypothetical protein